MPIQRAVRLFVVALTVLGALGMCGALIHAALAHQDGADPNAAFYRGLSANGINCCDMKDCRPTDSWAVTKDGHYQVKIGNEWAVVNDAQVIRQPNPTGMAIECHSDKFGTSGVWIRCFLPSSGV